MTLLNLETLLAPISAEQPCGLCKETSESLELLNAFAQMQQSGETARKIEKARAELELLPPVLRNDVIRDSAGRSNDPKKDPEWSSIVDKCCEIIESYSKDARVLGWLIEAMLRAHGYQGFCEALTVVTGLIETYGNQLYPIDPDSPVYAIGFLDRLNQSSSFIDGLGRVTVTSNTNVCYASKLLARHLESLAPDQRSELEESGMLSYDQIESNIQEIDAAVLKEFLDSMDEAIARSDKLDQLLTSLSGKASLGFSKIKNELQTVRAWFYELCESKLAELEAHSEEGQDAADGTADTDSDPNRRTQSGKPGVFQSRDEALSNLIKVASFFRRTEPHSPLSYSLEQAVRWGKMPLPDLLMELVRNDEVREEMFRRMGIQEKPQVEEN